MKPLGRRSAFTMVEIAIVCAIASIVMIVLFRLLVFGSRTVSLGSEEIEGIRRANIVMERIKRDLRGICDVVKVNDGAPEVDPDGRGITFMRFHNNATAQPPEALRVSYRAEKVAVVRGGEKMEGYKLQGFYGKSKTVVLSEDIFSDVRFKKYRLNGLNFYQIRLAVPDLTGKSGKTHFLQTSVGSRYYHTLFGDLNWQALDKTKFVPFRGGKPR